MARLIGSARPRDNCRIIAPQAGAVSKHPLQRLSGAPWSVHPNRYRNRDRNRHAVQDLVDAIHPETPDIAVPADQFHVMSCRVDTDSDLDSDFDGANGAFRCSERL
jgi:hypothetical protein